MAETAGDILIDTLLDWGVEVIFGLPGDGISGVLEALRKRQDRIRFIQVRHEESAALMACGYAKYTGKLGACIATSGPGAIHLLNGLYDAKMDGQPVVAITGMHYRDLIGTHAQQDVEADKLFENVAVYNQRVMGVGHVGPVTALACRTALARHGVAHVTIPVDVQSQTSEATRAARTAAHHNTEAFNGSARVPDQEAVRKAADLLNDGERVAILAGQGALSAADELEQTADLLGAPIAKALLGKAAVPDDSPFTTGSIGLLGTRPSQEAMENCDTLLIVGSSFPYLEFYPRPGQARGIQIDLDPARIGLRYPVEVGLIGDSKSSLCMLLPLLRRKEDRSFLGHAQRGMESWRKLMEERGSRTDEPMKPQVVAWELGRRLADDAIVSCDSGTMATWWARQIPAKRGQMFSLSGNLATMGSGLPYTIAAQVAYPHRQCVAFVGDGSFSMLMADFVTAVKYELPIKVVLIKNNSLGQMKWEQMVFLGSPEFGVELQPIDFAAFARACGGRGFTIDDPEDCGSLLDEALNADGPALVEAVVDPFEPPLPAKVTPRQAAKFAESLLRGEPSREKLALTVVSDSVREMV
jgi:pyruvate dehydrogenase (quinone)